MRLIATFGLVVSFCFSIQAEDAQRVTDVNIQLLTIELESYLNAYKDASANIREIETELAQTNTSESRATLETDRDSLRMHLDALAARANETAIRIGKTQTKTNKKKTLPDGTRVYLRNRLRSTGRDLDVAIEGQGFFQAVVPNTDAKVYARVGNLDIDANGYLVLGSARSGLPLSPSIQIPNDAIGITVFPNGEVSCTLPGETEMRLIGQMQLALFAIPGGLQEIDENRFSATEASGPARVTKPGQDGAGVIRQGTIEVSDSYLVRELIERLADMLMAERSAESLRPR
ncbi:Flagellar basal-body rod protein FlgG [Planctomycetes bacterium CA13]|uniref:Flagellar basal-body rod protein FlgG n=1 Tax=Novipirellula herctigrandis TaxID=2527986 RepID=A0A5C5YZ70_9BACT|nr:Flagellar basal-body rod protein FlgG [Planctomycetes bacterium CA13]